MNIEKDFVQILTITIQAGFIMGTLFFAVFNIADKFSARKLFFVCSLLAAIINLGMCVQAISITEVLFIRFLTGVLLAGIYPIGMKIASENSPNGLGISLGFLVGALVLGTALPHFIKVAIGSLPFEFVFYTTSFLAFVGGVLIYLFIPKNVIIKSPQKFKLTNFLIVFKSAPFRASAFGYWGHMWELFTFWMFVPAMLTAHKIYSQHSYINISLLSFIVIGMGSIACVIGGFLAAKFGEKKIATIALLFSCLCCLVSPFFYNINSTPLFVTFLIIWGMFVIADSPLFSTLIAHNAPQTYRGAALTIVNSIGFLITILSIKIINYLAQIVSPQYLYTFLAIGPILGLLTLVYKKSEGASRLKKV